MKQALLVFLGGGVGSVLRFYISTTLNPLLRHFFLGTFLVNVIGCLLIGFLLGITANSNYISQNQTLLLATGFCGGFTTFSTFAFENHSLLTADEFLNIALYTILSVVFGVLAVMLGLWCAKLL